MSVWSYLWKGRRRVGEEKRRGEEEKMRRGEDEKTRERTGCSFLA
jgi:hypothetical protein